MAVYIYYALSTWLQITGSRLLEIPHMGNDVLSCPSVNRGKHLQPSPNVLFQSLRPLVWMKHRYYVLPGSFIPPKLQAIGFCSCSHLELSHRKCCSQSAWQGLPHSNAPWKYCIRNLANNAWHPFVYLTSTLQIRCIMNLWWFSLTTIFFRIRSLIFKVCMYAGALIIKQWLGALSWRTDSMIHSSLCQHTI